MASRSEGRTLSANLGQPKIHLLLERVYLRHLHFHFVAEANNPSRPPAHEVIARGIEDIEIIFHRRKRN
jgi:hypothetical protein